MLAARPRVYLEELGLPGEHAEATGSVVEFPVASRPAPRFHGQVQHLAEELRRLIEQGYRAVFFAATTGDVERLADIFNEYGVAFQLGMRQAPQGSDGYLEEKAYIATPICSTVILKGPLARGAVFPDDRLALFGNQDLFDTSDLVAGPRAQQSKSRLSTFMSDFRDLKVGDYVVHMEHGVGRYLGLKEIAQHDGRNGEFMLLEYADEARLYVPLARLDLVQKYRSL